MYAATRPNKTKTDVKPRKNTDVIFVIALLSLNVYAKKAGTVGSMHGESKLSKPAMKAIMKEMFCRLSCACCSSACLSVSSCGSAAYATKEKTKANNKKLAAILVFIFWVS